MAEPINLPVKRLRLLTERDGRYYKLARISWSNSDASIYVTPYVPLNSTGFAGLMKVPDHGESNTINYSRQASGQPVRVTLHESGRCHASAGEQRTEPTWGRSLFHSETVHVATITCFDVGGLPTVEKPRGLPEPDIVMVGDGTAVHVPVYVCPTAEEAERFKLFVCMRREGRPRPLFVAFGGRSSEEPPDNRDPGVLVIAGWGPGDDPRPLTGVYGITSTGVPSEPDPTS